MSTDANIQSGQAPHDGVPAAALEAAAQGQAPTPTPAAKTDLEQRLEAAKADPKLLAELSGELLSVIASLRKEEAGRRTKLKTTEAELEELRKVKLERERAEMTELERIKAENEDYQKRLQSLEQSKTELEVKTAFTDANDPDDLLLYWNRLTDEQRAATTPAEWATQLQTTKPYLFKSALPAPPAGGNPRGDGGGGTPPAPAPIYHPQTKEEMAEVMRRHREAFT